MCVGSIAVCWGPPPAPALCVFSSLRHIIQQAVCPPVAATASAAAMGLAGFGPHLIWSDCYFYYGRLKLIIIHLPSAAQVDFLRRARLRPGLRRPHAAHCLAGALGGAAFVGEEFAPRAPLIHTAWHLLSAAGLAANGAFVEDAERHGPLP